MIQVTFGDIPIEAIEAYAKTEEPYIHSGGYELTGEAASFIKSISGSMTSIQGLDVYGVCHKIVEGSKKLGWIWKWCFIVKIVFIERKSYLFSGENVLTWKILHKRSAVMTDFSLQVFELN